MIHQIDVRRGRASYRNRFVRSRCFTAEQAVGGSLSGGLMDRAGTSSGRRPSPGARPPPGPQLKT